MPSTLQHLDDAVAEVFEVMLGGSCTLAGGAPASLHVGNALSASVFFSGSLEGTCGVHVDLRSADALARYLTGEEPEPGSPLPADAVGELCNMIAGSWKSRLDSHLSISQLSPPSFSHQHFAPADETAFLRLYHFEGHVLVLEVRLPDGTI